MHLLASFIRQYFKEFFEWIQSYDVQFHAKMIHFPQMKMFSGKPLMQVPCTSWALSLWKISKKSLESIQMYKDTPFLR